MSEDEVPVEKSYTLLCPQAGKHISPTLRLLMFLFLFSISNISFHPWGEGFMLFSKNLNLHASFIHFFSLFDIKAFTAVNFTSADSFECILFKNYFLNSLFILNLLLVPR